MGIFLPKNNEFKDLIKSNETNEVSIYVKKYINTLFIFPSTLNTRKLCGDDRACEGGC